MIPRALFIMAASILVTVGANAEGTRLVCENWHPRLGQMDDVNFAIDRERKTCNGHACKITETENSWSESGGRYEYVLNQSTGEGYALVASEKTALFKNCRKLANKT